MMKKKIDYNIYRIIGVLRHSKGGSVKNFLVGYWKKMFIT